MGAARELVERSLELYNNGDIEQLLALYAVNALEIGPDGPNNGRQAIGERLRAEQAAFPDKVLKPIIWVEDGNTVVVEYSWSGTQTGVLVFPDGTARPPTDESLAVAAVDIFHLRNGQIIAHRTYLDRVPPTIRSSQVSLERLGAATLSAPA